MDINWQGLITGAVTVFVITYFVKKAVYASEPGARVVRISLRNPPNGITQKICKNPFI